MEGSATDYVVVLSAISDARFREGEGLMIADFPTPVGAATFRFLTRFEDREFDETVPTDLWIEVRGTTASSINEVIEAYANAALGFLPLIGLSANAWVEDLEIKLAFDNTPGRREREFFQSFTSAIEPNAIRFGRPVDRDATFALTVALANHPEGERLRRVTEQYRLALSNWLNGHETLAIGHLWIAVEALTKVALRRECQRVDNATPQELADAWGIELRELDGEVRRRVIFRGDSDAARMAREASDGLEHGYLDFGAIRELARETRDATARYLREAILEFSDLDEAWRSRLLIDRYGTPLKSWIVRYLRGKLVGETDDLAAPDQAYPIFRRTEKLKSLSLREDGNYHFEMDENFNAAFSDLVQFQGTSFEVWGARDEAIDAPACLEVTGGTEQKMTTDEETSP